MNDEQRRAMYARTMDDYSRNYPSRKILGITVSQPKGLTQDQIRYREEQGLGYNDLAFRRLSPDQIKYRQKHGLGFGDL